MVKNKKTKTNKKNSDYTQYFWEKCFVVLSQEVTRNTIAESFQYKEPEARFSKGLVTIWAWRQILTSKSVK